MVNSVLQTMLVMVRLKVGDVQVRKYPEPLLVMAANEGKNELVKIIQQAHEGFFQKETTGTIPIAAAPNSSDIILPEYFSELRQIEITDSGYEDIGFVYKNQSDPRFIQALIDGGSFSNGQGMFYYDFVGRSIMRLSPGSDVALNYKIKYMEPVYDLTLPTSAPAEIPPQHYDFIVTWIICECFRSSGDARLEAYERKLGLQRDSVVAEVNARQTREPQFVRGFMEAEEYWG